MQVVYKIWIFCGLEYHYRICALAYGYSPAGGVTDLLSCIDNSMYGVLVEPLFLGDFLCFKTLPNRHKIR